MANLPLKQRPPQHHGPPTPTPTPSPHQQPLALILPNPPSHHNHLLRLAMIIMACTVGVLMFLCTVSVIMKHFHSRRHNRNRNSTDSPILFDVNNNEEDSDDSPVSDDGEVTHPIWFIRTVGLQQPFIDSITVFKYGKDEGLIDETECSVCLGEFQQGESLRLLPKCSHAFHIPCIDTWLRSHKNCPLCRAPVARDEVAVRAVDQNNTNNNNQMDENVSDHHQNQEADTENYEGSGGSDGVRIEETQLLRRSVSVDLSSSDSVMFGDVVVDLSSEGESSETQFGGKMDSNGKDIRSSSSSNCKLGSIGGASQKRPVSMRKSFSHSRKFLFSKHCRSQSSTLPL